MGVQRLAVANGPNIFQTLLVHKGLFFYWRTLYESWLCPALSVDAKRLKNVDLHLVDVQLSLSRHVGRVYATNLYSRARRRAAF